MQIIFPPSSASKPAIGLATICMVLTFWLTPIPFSGTFSARAGVVVYEVQPLDGMISSGAYGVNERGKVCAKSFNDSGDGVAMTWELPGVRVLLPALGDAVESSPFAINDQGQVSGFSRNRAGTKRVVRWLDAMTVEDIGGFYNQATGLTGKDGHGYKIASDGKVVGSADSVNDSAGFASLAAREKKYQYDNRLAYGINNVGEVVGVLVALDGRPPRPFISDPETGLQQLPVAPGFPGAEWSAVAINDLHMIGGFVTIDAEKKMPYYWQSRDSIPLRITLPQKYPYGEIYSVNNLGQMVGTMWAAGGKSAKRAFVFDTIYGLRDLNDVIDSTSGWELTLARDINDSGQIVGTGKLNGNTRGYMIDNSNADLRLKADVNRDGEVNLEDLVLSLLVFSGKVQPAAVSSYIEQ